MITVSVRGVVEQLSYDHKPKAIVLQGNVGDSRSVASVCGVVEQLSYDHKPKAIVLQGNVGDSRSVLQHHVQ
jgi:succinyl-CoA synthetase alpha subunit